MGRLTGKVAIVTGAARGQGAAAARAFVWEGASVLLTDVLDERGERVAAELGEAAAYQHLDVRKEVSWTAAVDRALDEFGRLDVLVNNAAILRAAPLEDTTLDEFREVVDVNQTGCFLGMRAVIGPLRGAGGGSIVNISSTGGLRGVPGVISYVASKFAVTGMTKTAALELAPDGIRVNSVHPGTVDTEMLVSPNFRDLGDALTAGIPLGRIGQPEEVAHLLVFLASDESAYCTGAEFVADGGKTVGVPSAVVLE